MSEMATQPQTCCALCGATHATSLLYRRGNGAWQCRDGEKCKTRRGEVQPAPAAAGAPAAAETAADGPVGAETVCGTCGRKSAFLREGSNCVRRDPDGMRCTGRMLAAAEPIRCARCGSSREGMTPHRRETGVCCKTEETTHPVTMLRQGEEPETVQHPAQVARLVVTAPANGEWPEIGDLPPGEVELRQDPLTEFEQSGLAVGALVTEKNAAYGDAFAKCGDFLRLLYPDGIRPEQYGDALCLVRMFDKMSRIATDKNALGESPYQDIAGYALLGMAKDARD